MRLRVQLFTTESGHSVWLGSGPEVAEHLRKLGLEFKTSDHLYDQTTVVVIEPHTDEDDLTEAQAKLDALRNLLDS